ncbi:hypothetical protein [Mesorhizobium sp. INR15]|uniref:helix-turn-helix transcriptional regulator n=1 Tax=Mesorhizobium sp. INR15 TaxID=2654248 RepID=UPI00189685EF|nr:hypothetical protein [Mesorhizobium sp. INR15]QPC94575.1 hypothetical protein GA829_30450 [Mesorhizobium sp. INR15]
MEAALWNTVQCSDMKISKRQNQSVAPRPAGRPGKVYLQTMISKLMEAITAKELKFRFRDSINHFGFGGFICDRSLFQPLSDDEILNDKRESDIDTSTFVTFFDESNLYNDIAQRLGSSSVSYLSAISTAAKTYFEDRRGHQARHFVRQHVTPFLNVTDAPRKHLPLLQTVFSIGTDFGQPAFRDRLSVPIEIAGGQTAYLGLFTQRTPCARDMLAGITLVYFYHELCRTRSAAPPDGDPVDAVVLGATQLECIKWAVAGKTIEDISVLTGLHYRTVRYHMEQARKRYGYATMRQTLARAACDYDLDPMG